jgi:hypothetical protein
MLLTSNKFEIELIQHNSEYLNKYGKNYQL